MRPQSTDMTNHNELNLKDCPFCGSDAIAIVRLRELNMVECIGCNAGTNLFDNRQNAINAWERRA